MELAKEWDDALLFLYVVDLGFLEKMAEAGLLNTEQELSRVGRSLLLQATARAADRGGAAETIVRTGQMREDGGHRPQGRRLVGGAGAPSRRRERLRAGRCEGHR
jgi:hypothetical protein